MPSILSVVADVLGVVGALGALWAAFRAKNAAEQARDAAAEVTRRIASLDTLADLSSSIEVITEIRTLLRLGEWALVLDRHTILRRQLVRISKAPMEERTRSQVARSLEHFRIIESKVQRAKGAGAFEHEEFLDVMETVSRQIDVLEGVMMEIKKQGVANASYGTA